MTALALLLSALVGVTGVAGWASAVVPHLAARRVLPTTTVRRSAKDIADEVFGDNDGKASGPFKFSKSVQPPVEEAVALDLGDLEQREQVQDHLDYAFDNYAHDEVVAMTSRLYNAASRSDADAVRSLTKILGLVQEMLRAKEAQARGADQEMVYDAVRTLCSQLRMWGKDAERYGDDGTVKEPVKWPWE